MKILLLGANSYVGSRLYLELSKYHKVIGTFHDKKIFDDLIHLDITDKKAVIELITKEKPEVIIHCANKASGKSCEKDPKQAIAVNQEATKYIVEAANSVRSKLIYISSFAAISHEDLYGKTKFESEHITTNTRAGYLIIQPGIIIGISPKIKKENGFFSSIMKNINEKTPAKYDNTKKSQPTYLGHICEILKLILDRNIWNKTIKVATSDLKTKYEMAKDILSPFGIEVEEIINEKPPILKEPKDMSELKELDLPLYTYQQIIKKVVEEIKHPNHYL